MTAATVVRAVLATVAAVAVLAGLYFARQALLIIYVSFLLATGLGPLVHYLEHAAAPGTQRLPRWLAILLIYLTIVGVLTVIGLLVIPPMIATAKPFSPSVRPIEADAWVIGAIKMPAAPPSAAARPKENANIRWTLMPISAAALRSNDTACIARPIKV